jgi:hypothetical protein
MNSSNRFYTALFTVLLLAFTLYAFTFPAGAQTAEPELSTPVDNPTPEPTPSDGVVISPDGTITVTDDGVTEETVTAYETAFKGILAVLLAVIAAGGGYAIVRALKTPEQAKAVTGTVIDVLKILANFTPTPVDNAGLDALRDALVKYLDEQIAVKAAAIAQAAAIGSPSFNPQGAPYRGDPSFLAPDGHVPDSEPE